ncbi:hypothetical protein PLUTO_00030 [Luteibacter phage vB_LflM-Pluto]|uniref:Uncharacterized protein n=1 Tax=Luteibacter phage vB_LflM-Pluto TaxID=2948611 RepID=A0A9E7MTN9_9CAUD|nr:hypothetical protein PLUTO_00030 [Luteibacter phage vB_LflM-Pluto]
MALTKRILKVTITLPSGEVVLDQSLDLRVRVHKAALAIQSRATIEALGLTTSLREKLISQFTAWHKRQVETGQATQDWINIQIEAGYENTETTAAAGSGTQTTAVIFVGQVVNCEPSSSPPNIGVRIVCYSRQIDKTAFISTPAPAQTTYYNYVKWAAEQMGFGNNFICETSFNDVVIENPARSIIVVGALLIDIQNMYRPAVAAFVDNNQLIVKDQASIINKGATSNLTEFVGTPFWTEWGVQFTVLFDSTLKLAQAAALTSKMNPGINNTYVVTELDYDLASRTTPFYVTGNASPPA